MNTAERLAYFLGHGVTDIDFLAKVVDAEPDVFRPILVKAIRRHKITALADEAMRLDASIRDLDSREWKALSFDEQLDRAAFLFRTFKA